jgi:hypothetical protein
MILRKGRRNGKEKTRKLHLLHISAMIQTTIATIVISIFTPMISVGRYI